MTPVLYAVDAGCAGREGVGICVKSHMKPNNNKGAKQTKCVSNRSEYEHKTYIKTHSLRKALSHKGAQSEGCDFAVSARLCVLVVSLLHSIVHGTLVCAFAHLFDKQVIMVAT